MKEAEEVFATTLDNLEQQAKAENIEIFNRQIFKDDPSAAIQNLKRQVVKVVIITSIMMMIMIIFISKMIVMML